MEEWRTQFSSSGYDDKGVDVDGYGAALKNLYGDVDSNEPRDNRSDTNNSLSEPTHLPEPENDTLANNTSPQD